MALERVPSGVRGASQVQTRKPRPEGRPRTPRRRVSGSVGRGPVQLSAPAVRPLSGRVVAALGLSPAQYSPHPCPAPSPSHSPTPVTLPTPPHGCSASSRPRVDGTRLAAADVPCVTLEGRLRAVAAWGVTGV